MCMLGIDTHRPDAKNGKTLLRELEQQIRQDIEDGIDSTGKKMTLCQLMTRTTEGDEEKAHKNNGNNSCGY